MVLSNITNREKFDVVSPADKAAGGRNDTTRPNLTARHLSEILRKNDVCLGGSSMGKGFYKAARYYLGGRESSLPEFLKNDSATALRPEFKSKLTRTMMATEDSFYVVDIGVIISQFYQWQLHFPRVKPFYAVKCNPDPLIVETLSVLGAGFDCASRNEIRLVQDIAGKDKEIIYANPTKGTSHLVEAVCRGVRMVTFDNVSEVKKCAAVSGEIQMILRIVTDDRGSQCRLSTKYGAPRSRWRPLLAAAKNHGLSVVGVSFHVGSGCRDATRYELALKDAREIFNMAARDYGFKMTLLDIGGGFPGETHSTWNPADLDEEEEDETVADSIGNCVEGLDPTSGYYNEAVAAEPDESKSFMFFTEIADAVRPIIDKLFPEEEGVRIIAEPGRYFVAASATLVASVISARCNIDDENEAVAVDDIATADALDAITRAEEKELVRNRGISFDVTDQADNNVIIDTIVEEMSDYSKLYAMQHLAQQEADTYNDEIDLYKEDFETAIDLLGPPDDIQRLNSLQTVEGMNSNLVGQRSSGESFKSAGILTLAAAGEAAVNGIMVQAVADSAPLQDDYAYYMNDGVYGAFNNIMFDHATVRPRQLRKNHKRKIVAQHRDEYLALTLHPENSDSDDDHHRKQDDKTSDLYKSTVFGPTCDSIDVIARSILLPKLEVGDWLYFQNMGAYTMAAASSFNGFNPSEIFYVCSVHPQFF
mmetsp:Transcript_18467/g.42272  ORF Transcript_18467/g.42272 Transcript_18467/m.42272 type:complete len:706 (+) Transcript_18467:75-2192(+)